MRRGETRAAILLVKSFLLRIAYHGAGFHGWASQTSGVRTVANELLAALRPLCQGEPSLQGASRTDAGVHALGQAAHVKAETRLEAQALLRALNATLARDVRVLAARDVPETFDPRHGAEQKWYRYRILERIQGSPLEEATAWHIPKNLELEAIQPGGLSPRHSKTCIPYGECEPAKRKGEARWNGRS